MAIVLLCFRMFLAILLVTTTAHAKKDYCQFKCFNGFVNLACNHDEKPDKSCVDFNHLILDETQQQLVIDHHNNFRSYIATGQGKNGTGHKLPPAKNMNKLAWSDELAYLAYLNVLQCRMNHDKCRNTETQNGQNLYSLFSTRPHNVNDILIGGIKAWFDEIADFDLPEISTFIGGGKIIGHFTQLIWAKSTHVGCAVASHKQGIYDAYLMACNYVRGNVLGQSVYEAGKNCEDCSTCTKNGLCSY